MRIPSKAALPALVVCALFLSPVHCQTANNPLVGYPSYTQSFAIPYTGGSGLTDANGPRIKAVIAGTEIVLPIDTGSRALYASQDLVPGITNPEGPAGYVYLNSSARIFQGTWSTQTITFPDAVGTGVSGPAQAVVPVLVVNTLACSTTPPPGSATATTTFATIPGAGTVTLTNGQSVAYTNHTLTLTGGQAVSYTDNPGVLASVVNFGVGFDRTGQGTSPNNNSYNQQYNAFLNVLQMRASPPTMRAGFVLAQSGVQLGLTAANSGYAYTNLIPTGLAQNPPSPPDWQAPMGNVVYGGTTYATGQLVVDTGINFSILTLPGLSGATAAPPLTVNLLNSGGAVSYDITSDVSNTLAPTAISVFPPLAGNFSENAGTTRDQFFNTGRRVLNAFDFLYDAVDGYVGLARNATSVPSANIAFTPGYYPAPIPPSAQTATIPLVFVNAADAGDSPIYKLGIYVGLGGGAPQLYEFDTGGVGFFAAQNTTPQSWWPASSYTVLDGGQTFTASYSSGITYTAQLVSTQVALYGSADPSSLVATVGSAEVGQITDATIHGSSASTRALDWTAYQNNPANPPVWGHFYGDFGANLSPYTNTSPAVTLDTILPQLPGNLSSGFIISTGGYANPHPTLQIGLTAADRASFPIQLPLLDANPASPYPNSGYPSYGFFQTWGYFSLGLDGATQAASTEVILDTGAPSMTIRTGTSLAIDGTFLTASGDALSKGTAFSLTSGAWTLAFTVGDKPSLDEVGVSPSVNAQNLAGYINTGLNAFFAYDVMYDVERGVIGFRPVSSPAPTPAPTPAPAPPVVKVKGPHSLRTGRDSIRVSGNVRGAVSDVEFRRAGGHYVRTQGNGGKWSFYAGLQNRRTIFYVRAIAPDGTAGKPVKIVVTRL
jgi:hypothetical protein